MVLRVARGTDYLGLLSARREARAKAEATNDTARVAQVEAAFRTFVDGAESRFREAVEAAPEDAAALCSVRAPPSQPPSHTATSTHGPYSDTPVVCPGSPSRCYHRLRPKSYCRRCVWQPMRLEKRPSTVPYVIRDAHTSRTQRPATLRTL